METRTYFVPRHSTNGHEASEGPGVEAPVMALPLAALDLPAGFRRWADAKGFMTVGDVVGFVDEPDKKTGRKKGLAYFLKVSRMGEKKLARLDEAFVAVGVDLTR